ncbi:MAG: ADP-ribosylation factor-like protein [Candidatus Hodarchaeales archaeon]
MQTKKIVVVGLAKSGKSVLIDVVTEARLASNEDDYNASGDYQLLLKSYDDTDIVFFDLGGQTAFLDRHTGALAEYFFGGVNSLIFIVDSIEIKDISRAKHYLDLSMKKLEQFSPEATVFIFQHKVDIIPKKMRQEVYQTIKDYLMTKIPSDIPYYETTVFDTSIVVAMSAVYQTVLGYIPNNWFNTNTVTKIKFNELSTLGFRKFEERSYLDSREVLFDRLRKIRDEIPNN